MKTSPVTLLMLVLIFVFCNLIFTAGILLFAAARKVWVEEVRIFFGPTVLAVPVRGVVVKINTIPLGSSVKFGAAPRENHEITNQGVDANPTHRPYVTLPHAERVLLALSAPLVTFAFGAFLIGPGTAAKGWLDFFPQFVRGALDPNANGAQRVREFFGVLDTDSYKYAAGMFAVKFSAFNCLPAAACIGATVMMEALRALRVPPLVERMVAQLFAYMMVPLLIAIALWAYALIHTITRG
jgi:membrane-associated protease RseP (regulator of RpoE activity)